MEWVGGPFQRVAFLNLRRVLPRIPFVSGGHREEAGSAAKRMTPDGGEVHSAGSTGAADESRDPSARKRRGPQDDKTIQIDKAIQISASTAGRDVDVFRAFVRAGQRLAEIHVQYEKQPEYPLTKTEKKGERLDYRVEKMKLSKDKSSLIYNKFLTLSDIPKEACE